MHRKINVKYHRCPGSVQDTCPECMQSHHWTTLRQSTSASVGLNNLKTQTQICAGHQIQVTWIHRSSTCQNVGTCLKSGSCRYLKMFISLHSYQSVLIQRICISLCLIPLETVLYCNKKN